jgi:hypothetical protein
LDVKKESGGNLIIVFGELDVSIAVILLYYGKTCKLKLWYLFHSCNTVEVSAILYCRAVMLSELYSAVLASTFLNNNIQFHFDYPFLART